MVEIKTERASYYISTHGKCEYIDIEPGTDTFTFFVSGIPEGYRASSKISKLFMAEYQYM